MPKPEKAPIPVSSLEITIKETLGKLVDGARADVAEFLSYVSIKMLEIQQIPDPQKRANLTNEIVRQGKLLAEKNRLRAVNGQWTVVSQAILDLSNLVIKSAL